MSNASKPHLYVAVSCKPARGVIDISGTVCVIIN